jgi:Uma2 family endonuclease
LGDKITQTLQSRLRAGSKRRILIDMATQPMSGRLIPVEEYLSTGYDPDCEYDDGVIVERNLGEIEHAYLQTLLATLFTVRGAEWNVLALTEQRIQIGPKRFLVPDVCVLGSGAPWEGVLTHPPFIAIEIMSPEDTIRRATAKAAEYLGFGVKNVWVIDPSARVAYRGVPSGLELVRSGELVAPGTAIVVSVTELFEKLDNARIGNT